MSKQNSTTSPHKGVNNTEQPAIAALIKFAKQRSGIDRRDYFSTWHDKEGVKAWREEVKSIAQDLRRFRTSLSIAEAEGVTDADLIAEAPHAFSGRLTPVETDRRFAWEYVTGQYFPTEYRKAAATLLEYATRRVRQAQPPETRQITTIADLRELHERIGGCWFERSTMRFFGTRIESGVIRGHYFITSDKRGFDDSAGRGYSVRCFNDEGDIHREIGSVGEFDSKQKAIDALKEHLDPKACGKCGTVKPREETIVEGTGHEYGSEFFYCSETCKEGSANVSK